MSAGQLGGAVMALGGMALVAMQFMNGPGDEVKVPADASGGRLKKTLTNAGLYPTPEAPGSKLKKTNSGSMAVFTSGDASVALSKGGGEPL